MSVGGTGSCSYQLSCRGRVGQARRRCLRWVLAGSKGPICLSIISMLLCNQINRSRTRLVMPDSRAAREVAAAVAIPEATG